MTARLPLIGLAGRPGSGKSTAAGILCDYHAFAAIVVGLHTSPEASDLWIDWIEDNAITHHYSGIVTEIPDDTWAAWLRARGGTVWHLLRPVPGGRGSGIAALPGDRTLDNTGTLEQLENTVDYLLHGSSHATDSPNQEPAVIGQMLRYGHGETALMIVEYVSPGHGGALARYFGRQCMGGKVGAYHDQCTAATVGDRATWGRYNP